MKGFVNYTYTSSLAIGYGSAPAVRHLRFEDVHFVTNQNKFAVWIQLTPAYFTGKGYTSGQKSSEGIVLDDFKFVNTTFGDDGGHIYIDGGKDPVTNFVFENCNFGKATRPGMLMGTSVGPILFKHDTMNGDVVRSADQLKRDDYEIFVPVRFQP